MESEEDEQILPTKLQLSYAVPPDSIDGAHLDNLQIFIDDLNVAVTRALARDGSPYEHVHVLFLRWEDDDFLEPGVNNGIQGEIDGLEHVFTNFYGYKTETYLIPSDNSQRSLQKKIFQFQDDHDSRSDLLLVYYGGHGRLNKYNQSIWAQGDGPSVDWYSIQHILENAAADVAIFLDCCYAASADKRSVDGTIEVLAACCRETETIGISKWSFTNRLTEVLEDSFDRPLTIALLHAKLVNYRGVEGLKKLTKTPVHSIMSDSIKASIRLFPVSPGPTFPLSLSISDFSNSSPSNSSSLSGRDASPSRVLIAISLKDKTQDVGIWLQWLTTHMPADIENFQLVRPEAFWGSHSTLSLISMPIAVWSMFPYHAAYRCFCYVTTPNLLPNDLRSVAKVKAPIIEWADLVPQRNGSSLSVIEREDLIISVSGDTDHGVNHFIAQAIGQEARDGKILSSKSRRSRTIRIASFRHEGKSVHLIDGGNSSLNDPISDTDLEELLAWLQWAPGMTSEDRRVHGLIHIHGERSNDVSINVDRLLRRNQRKSLINRTPITILSDDSITLHENPFYVVQSSAEEEYVILGHFDGTQVSALKAISLHVKLHDETAMEPVLRKSVPEHAGSANQHLYSPLEVLGRSKMADLAMMIDALRIITGSACTIM